jgi:hypothetical protein
MPVEGQPGASGQARVYTAQKFASAEAHARLRCHVLLAADVPKKTICTLPLNQKEVTTFSNAVKKHYWCVLPHGTRCYDECAWRSDRHWHCHAS